MKFGRDPGYDGRGDNDSESQGSGSLVFIAEFPLFLNPHTDSTVVLFTKTVGLILDSVYLTKTSFYLKRF